jgi:MerR family transcriptional regulator, copper efflux regulator
LRSLNIAITNKTKTNIPINHPAIHIGQIDMTPLLTTSLVPEMPINRIRRMDDVLLVTLVPTIRAVDSLELRTVVQPYNQVMEGLTTAKLAKEGGVNVETIRYYERHGLLPRVPRTASGYRQFSESHAIRLRFIRHAQKLGFTLKEVKELLNLRVKPGSGCADVRRKAEGKITDVDSKIRHLQTIKKALLKLTATCAGQGPVTNCSILEALDGQENF